METPYTAYTPSEIEVLVASLRCEVHALRDEVRQLRAALATVKEPPRVTYPGTQPTPMRSYPPVYDDRPFQFPMPGPGFS